MTGSGGYWASERLAAAGFAAIRWRRNPVALAPGLGCVAATVSALPDRLAKNACKIFKGGGVCASAGLTAGIALAVGLRTLCLRITTTGLVCSCAGDAAIGDKR